MLSVARRLRRMSRSFFAVRHKFKFMHWITTSEHESTQTTAYKYAISTRSVALAVSVFRALRPSRRLLSFFTWPRAASAMNAQWTWRIISPPYVCLKTPAPAACLWTHCLCVHFHILCPEDRVFRQITTSLRSSSASARRSNPAYSRLICMSLCVQIGKSLSGRWKKKMHVITVITSNLNHAYKSAMHMSVHNVESCATKPLTRSADQTRSPSTTKSANQSRFNFRRLQHRSRAKREYEMPKCARSCLMRVHAEFLMPSPTRAAQHRETILHRLLVGYGHVDDA